MDNLRRKPIIATCATILVAGVIIGGAIWFVKQKSLIVKAEDAWNSSQRPGNIDTTSTKEKTSSAVTNGTLTQRQADLLLAELDSLSSQMGGNWPNKSGDDNTIPPTGTPPAVAQQNGEDVMLQRIVDLLNEKSLTTTVEELKAAHEAAQKAGIQIFGNRGTIGKSRQGTPPAR